MDVKKVFKRYGFTQAQVAERMGITRSALASCISRGKPLPTTLHRIADAIGADYTEFFEDEVSELDRMEVERRQLELNRLRLQHKLGKAPDVEPTFTIDGAIDGGIITLKGRRYKQVFVPIEEE